MLMRLLAVLAALALVPACKAQAPTPERYQAGVHYFLIEPPQSTAPGTVEVVEVFSYACIHCNNFQPMVDRWKASKPAKASFSYLPAAWNSAWEAYARAFYAAEVLGVLDKSHQALLDAIWKEGKQFQNMEQIAEWFGTQGVKPEDFLAAASSFAVNTKIQRSKALVPRYGVEGTPSVIVAGKYRVTGESAQGYDKVFDVVNFLVEKEAAALK